MFSGTFSVRVMSVVALLLAGCGMRSDMTAVDFDDGESTTPSGGTTSATGAAGGNRSSAIPSGGASAIPSGGASAIPSGGASAIPSGGASAIPSGGTSLTSSRGRSSRSSGGATSIAGSRASGGTMASSRTGGAGVPSGGTTVFTSSGAGGSSSRASSSTPSSCAGVTCPALPKSCKKIVQDPTACCPVCTDTGCQSCDVPVCAAGTHIETIPGDCCPSCVPDPLDSCKKGQKGYADFRKQLFEKYGSDKCQNSLDCSLVLESNACTTVCNVPVPTSHATAYSDNLTSFAKANCAACPTPPTILCERMVPSCLNNRCVAAEPL